MDENRYNDLDKLFRSRLRTEEAGSEAWNTPSEDVFTDAMARINPEKKRRFALIWLLPLILIPFLAGIIIWQQDRMTKMQSEISRLERSGEVTTSSADPQNEIIRSEKAGLTPDQDPVAEIAYSSSSPKTNSREADISKNSTILNKDVRSNSNINIEPVAGEIHDLTKASDLTTNTESSDRSFEGTLPVPSLDQEFHITDKLPIGLSELSMEAHGPMIEKPEPVDQVKEDRSTLFSTFFMVSTELTTFNMTNLPPANYSLTEYEEYYMGYSVGLGCRLHIDQRWSLEMTGAYHHTYNKSEYIEEMPYDKSKEVSSPGQPTTYETMVDLVSPTGASRQPVSMNVDNVNIPDRDMIKNHTFIDQNFNIISLSMAPRFHFLNGPKLKSSVGIGGRLNYLLNTSEKMSVSLYHQNRTLTNETFEQKNPPTINRFFGGLYGNVDLQYMITDHYSIGLHSGYYRSLSTIKKYNDSDGARTYLNSFDVSLTFSMLF